MEFVPDLVMAFTWPPRFNNNDHADAVSAHHQPGRCASAIQFLLNISNTGQARPTRSARQNIFFPRLDWHINQKNDAFVKYSFANFDSTFGYSVNPVARPPPFFCSVK